MVPSEELELSIFRFAESAGKASWRPVDIGILQNATHFHETPILVDALFDLHVRKLIEFRQWSHERHGWIPFDDNDGAYLYRPFEMRVTFPGRKYFERLEAEKHLQVIAKHPPVLVATVPVGVPLKAKLDSSPQNIAAAAMRNPTAFVSHSGKDRHFVDRFAPDLWAAGVKAWYSKWEIKPGDSIPAKIDAGLEDCEFFIIVLSRNSVGAPWVQTELQAALARMVTGAVKKIIPITIDDCDNFPAIIGQLCREDFANQPYELALKRVLDSIFDVDVRPQLGDRSTEGAE